MKRVNIINTKSYTRFAPSVTLSRRLCYAYTFNACATCLLATLLWQSTLRLRTRFQMGQSEWQSKWPMYGLALIIRLYLLSYTFPIILNFFEDRGKGTTDLVFYIIGYNLSTLANLRSIIALTTEIYHRTDRRTDKQTDTQMKPFL